MEKELLNQMQLAASKSRNCVLFRNNTGQGWAGRVIERSATRMVLQDFRPIHAGLVKGSSDLIGWTIIEITPKMVGRKMAIFTAFEAKTKTVKLTHEQANFLNRVTEAGGIAAEIRDVPQIINAIEFFKAQE